MSFLYRCFRYLLPGWRLGWITIHDHQKCLEGLKKVLLSLATRLCGPCTVAQAALPTILHEIPSTFFSKLRKTLKENAGVATDILAHVPGITPVRTYGTMYLTVLIDLEHFDKFKSDVDFAQNLICEQSLYCFPGSMYYVDKDGGKPAFIRLVLSHSCDIILNACRRLEEFCMINVKKNIPL